VSASILPSQRLMARLYLTLGYISYVTNAWYTFIASLIDISAAAVVTTTRRLYTRFVHRWLHQTRYGRAATQTCGSISGLMSSSDDKRSSIDYKPQPLQLCICIPASGYEHAFIMQWYTDKCLSIAYTNAINKRDQTLDTSQHGQCC
jgi:hypothetical protein